MGFYVSKQTINTNEIRWQHGSFFSFCETIFNSVQYECCNQWNYFPLWLTRAKVRYWTWNINLLKKSRKYKIRNTATLLEHIYSFSFWDSFKVNLIKTVFQWSIVLLKLWHDTGQRFPPAGPQWQGCAANITVWCTMLSEEKSTNNTTALSLSPALLLTPVLEVLQSVGFQYSGNSEEPTQRTIYGRRCCRQCDCRERGHVWETEVHRWSLPMLKWAALHKLQPDAPHSLVFSLDTGTDWRSLVCRLRDEAPTAGYAESKRTK